MSNNAPGPTAFLDCEVIARIIFVQRASDHGESSAVLRRAFWCDANQRVARVLCRERHNLLEVAV